MRDHIYLNKDVAYLLCMFMLIRHYFFYSSVGYIEQEFGVKQNFIAFLLIPVTSSFGIYLAFLTSIRAKLAEFKNINLKLVAIVVKLLLIVVLFNVDKDLSVIYQFQYDQVAQKPRLLILIPIMLSIVLNIYVINVWRLWICVIFCGIIYYFYPSFIVHYLIIFLMSQLMFSFLVSLKIRLVSKNAFFVSLFIMAVIITNALYWETARVHILVELVWGFSYFMILYNLSSALFSNFYFFKTKISILTFYIIQAILFTIIFNFLNLFDLDSFALKISEFAAMSVICFFSYYLSRKYKIL